MKHSRIWFHLSWISQAEVSASLAPLLMMALPFTLLFHSKVFSALLLIAAAYILLAHGSTRIHRLRARKSGMRYFYLMPIHPVLLRLLIRGRVPLPKGRRFYTVHVLDDVQRDSPKEALADMLSDFTLLQDQSFSANLAFVGNTFADFGTRQMRLICRNADVRSIPGTFLPGQPMLVTRRRLREHQCRILGRSFPLGKIEWKIMIVCPRDKQNGGAE